MLIIGCDYHPGFQQIACVDSDTGELSERRLAHREQAEDAYGLRGSCGFTFGNGCDFGPPHSTLFGGKMGRRTLTPIRPLDT